jgi:hypothetical protein
MALHRYFLIVNYYFKEKAELINRFSTYCQHAVINTDFISCYFEIIYYSRKKSQSFFYNKTQSHKKAQKPAYLMYLNKSYSAFID